MAPSGTKTFGAEVYGVACIDALENAVSILSQRQKFRRLADSQTDGLELLSPLATRQSHCGAVPTLDLGSIWEDATPILGDVFLDGSRGRPRVAGDLRAGSGAPTGATANEIAVTAGHD